MEALAKRMMIGLIVAATLSMPSVASAETRSAFCLRWRQVCDKACPTVARDQANCHAICLSRTTDCRISGCYDFRRIGMQCQKTEAR